MKRSFIFFAVIFSITGIAVAQPKIETGETKKSFGTVRQGEPVVLTYTFTNAGTEPLIFDDFEVTCSCTDAILPAQPVLPGQTASITVGFKTAAAIGLQNRIVKVHSNDRKSPLKLRFKGVVEMKTDKE